MEKKGVPINNFFTIFEKALFQRGVEIILTVRRGERQRAMECGCGVFRAGRKGSGYRQGRSSVVRKPRQKDFAERSRVRHSFTKAQASRPWIPVALSLLSPFARLLRRLMTAARPCGTRAALAATNVAAHTGAKPHITHSAVNMALQQSDPPQRLAGRFEDCPLYGAAKPRPARNFWGC